MNASTGALSSTCTASTITLAASSPYITPSPPPALEDEKNKDALAEALAPVAEPDIEHQPVHDGPRNFSTARKWAQLSMCSVGALVTAMSVSDVRVAVQAGADQTWLDRPASSFLPWSSFSAISARQKPR